MNHKTWGILFIITASGLGLYALRLDPALESFVFVSYSALAAVAMFAGVFIYRPRPLAGWLLFAIGQLLVALGDFIFVEAVYLQNEWAPALLPGIFYIAGQAAFLLGLSLVYFTYRTNMTTHALAQGIIVAIGLAALIWITEVSPNLNNGLTWHGWLWTLAFPTGMLLLFTLASVVLLTPVGSPRCFRMMFAGLVCCMVGYQFYQPSNTLAISTAHTPLFSPTLVHLVYLNDFSYSTGYLLLGMAFLHPTFSAYRLALPLQDSTISMVEIILLSAAFWLAPAVYVINNLFRYNTDVLVMLASMTVIFTLFEWRLARVVRLLETQNIHLRRHREELQHQAYHDELTRLPNRAHLYKELESMMVRTLQTRAYGAVLLIDVDHFKQVNDTLGHDVGDQVLVEIAGALTRLKRKEDVVGRWGGDEFLVIMGITQGATEASESALALARRLEQEVRLTVRGEEGQVDVSISIGISLIPSKDARLQTVIKQADLALYQAKRGGDSHVLMYR